VRVSDLDCISHVRLAFLLPTIQCVILHFSLQDDALKNHVKMLHSTAFKSLTGSL
jgi:ethanolamine ammonia-lyase large subunit